MNKTTHHTAQHHGHNALHTTTHNNAQQRTKTHNNAQQRTTTQQNPKKARFENDRTISFIPPDGAFDLMSYRLSQNVKPLIWVECLVERPSRSRTDYVVKARSQFKER